MQSVNNFRILLDVAKLAGWSVEDLLDTATYVYNNKQRLSGLTRLEYHYLLNEREWPGEGDRPPYIEL